MRAEFFASLLKQIYLNEPYIPAFIHVPVEFEDRELLEEISQRAPRAQSGDSHAAARPEEGHAGAGGIERPAQLRAALPRAEAVLARRFRRRCRTRWDWSKRPRRIECFDISHIQGTDKVASMVVWEDGRMKKSDYRKFIIKTVEGNDDFAQHARGDHAALRAACREGAKTAGRPRPWCWWTADWDSCTRRRRRSKRWESPISRWLRSPSARNGFTSTARKTNRWCWTISRRCCTWCRWCATRRIASR